MTEKKPVIISTQDFVLPFLKKNHRAYIAEQGYKKKRTISDKIPDSAIFLGCMHGIVDASPYSTWYYEDDFYIISLTDDEFDWALFRVSWDDNWQLWNLVTDARISGEKKSFKNAALLMFKELMSFWGMDSEDPQTESLQEIIEEIEEMEE